MRSETIRVVDMYKSIRENSKQLDPTNIKILTTMAKLGPRNLLEVSRFCGIPFTTVYHRVAQMELKSKQIAILIPSVARIGLVRVIVLASARAGEEERVTKALRIPNMWRSIEPCEGTFTHHSIQVIPANLLKQFKEYVAKMREANIIKNYRIIIAGDSIPNFPDFSNYNPATGEWTFNWETWLNELNDPLAPAKMITDFAEPPIAVDKTDLQIIENLELNGRANFTDIARDVGVSPQTVKYRYDTKLATGGVVDQFQFDVVPYPIEMAAYHEVMLQFTSTEAMNKFFSLVGKLFFILSVSKVQRENTLIVRTFTLHSQVSRMFKFFSEMARDDLIESYSAVRLDPTDRHMQTISSELFNDQEGWTWDINKSLTAFRYLYAE